MTLHFRLDETAPGHRMFTIFVNGKNSGRLIMTHSEAIQFVSIFEMLTVTTHHRLILTGEWDNDR